MAKIFGRIKGIEVPDFRSDEPYEAYEKRVAAYKEAVRKAVKKGMPEDGCVGEIIGFPAGDGYALYMVASMKPLELVHLAVGDAWHFQYANRLTAKDVREEIRRERGLASIFSKKGGE